MFCQPVAVVHGPYLSVRRPLAPRRLRLSFRASCRIRTNDPEITNHVLWPTELKRRVGKLTISRRYDLLPLLRSSPGGFTGSWPYRTYPFCGCKGRQISLSRNSSRPFFHKFASTYLSKLTAPHDTRQAGTGLRPSAHRSVRRRAQARPPGSKGQPAYRHFQGRDTACSPPQPQASRSPQKKACAYIGAFQSTTRRQRPTPHKKRGIKFFPTMLYIIMKAVNQNKEFRMSFDENGRLGYWEQVVPCYTLFHPDTHTFTDIWSEYSDDFDTFYPKSVIRVQSDFVLPPCRLAVAFVEGVAGYVEAKRQTRCRRQDERAWKAVERLSGTRQGGLMTDLGLSHSGRRYGAVSRRNRRHQGTPRATGQILPRLLPTVAKLHRFCTRHIHGKPIPVSSHQVREIFRRERTNADTRLGLCQPCRSRRIPYVQAHQRHAGHSTPILTRP